jgi:nucleoside-diphosphate-sugar epimerase
VVFTAPEIVAKMRAVAPPGQRVPDPAVLGRLAELTRALHAAMPDATAEYARFLAIAGRSLALPGPALDDWLGGRTVLVTGGTGCIGSRLLPLLAGRRPRRLVSVSRGVTGQWPRLAGAEYLRADIRDRCALGQVFGAVRPDIVFHLAAQREPGLAERAVRRTVATNVLGTQNVLGAAAEFAAGQVVCASTGKALRPYSPDVYAASKRAAEWLMGRAAQASRTRYSAARFTHVVDNSIVHGRLLDWCQRGPARLHSPDIAFYAESALESAELLLAAGLGARPGELRVHVITDLGWPVSLLSLALGALRHTGSDTPIYFSGYDRGYETAPFPGLYDPRSAGEVSPLVSAFEAAVAQPQPPVRADAFPLAIAAGPEPDERLRALAASCATGSAGQVRGTLDELSWSLLDATLSEVARPVLARAAQLAGPHRAGLSPEHQRMLASIARHAGPAGVPAAAQGVRISC